MQAILFYVTLCLGIIVAQTTVLRPPFFPPVLFDLLIPVIVFSRLHLRTRSALILALVNGFMMDLFSGVQFGVYMSIYMWIFFGVSGVSSFFNLRGNSFRSILIAAAVLLENLLCCLFSNFPGNFWAGLLERFNMVVWQVVLAAFTGTAIIALLEHVQKKLVSAQMEKKKKTGSLWMQDI